MYPKKFIPSTFIAQSVSLVKTKVKLDIEIHQKRRICMWFRMSRKKELIWFQNGAKFDDDEIEAIK